MGTLISHDGALVAILALLAAVAMPVAGSPSVVGELRSDVAGANTFHFVASEGRGATTDLAYPIMEWILSVCAVQCVSQAVLQASHSAFESAYWTYSCPCPNQDVGAKDIVGYRDDFVARAECLQDFQSGRGWGYATFWFGVTFPVEYCNYGWITGGLHVITIGDYTFPYSCAIAPTFRIVIDADHARDLPQYFPQLNGTSLDPNAEVVLVGSPPGSPEFWMVAQCQGMALRS